MNRRSFFQLGAAAVAMPKGKSAPTYADLCERYPLYVMTVPPETWGGSMPISAGRIMRNSLAVERGEWFRVEAGLDAGGWFRVLPNETPA